ncbi:hypothetical protein GCM10027277_57490 [Pseudoduganella ginsengisoli]|uniref:2-oxoglutarate-dependent dioxygenase n=1 Tax=Pseudoduganella ginsengisoli TaxID=1462440 RepID=A0A6L6Q7Y1_9BURK|nr:2OG-Fe(II) oxygenase [Pseudoduganella ginsengisoli]MTW05887.1 2-oxoglutarate-dependent dioxygenase [Pseudoduganella ginsengisoli]
MGAMTDNLVQAISPQWHAWIKDGLSRGCSVDSMIQVLVRDGRFSRAVAIAAINATKSDQSESNALRPFVDTSKNYISTPDRKIQVILSVEAPNVAVLGNVLSDEECDALIAYGEAGMSRSHTVAATGGGQIDPGRTSYGVMMQRGELDLITKIEARLAHIANWPVERGEGLQLLRYGVGAEYKPHFDWFNADIPGQAQLFGTAGQRVGTIVMYLNDVEAGGGTLFPELGLEVAPRKGGAVFFTNITPEGTPCRLSLHGGSPVISGVKYVATKWLREKVF